MTKALCPVYQECGGCQYQHLDYADELKEKDKLLKGILSLPENLFEAPVASLVDYHYRHRLDLKLQRTREKGILIGFSPQGRKRIVEVEQCPIACKAISDFIPRLKREAIERLPAQYKVANLVVRCGQEGEVHWGGIGKRSLRMKEQDYFWVDLCGKRVHYAMETFFQANLAILPVLMGRLRALPIWSTRPVFYDLYGGVGLFGICLSDLVSRVVLIEENLASCVLARHNMQYNGLTNFEIHGARLEDRLPQLLESDREDGKVVMVDPPRAGLSQTSIDLLNSLQGVEHVLYLSCHPQSLKENLTALSSHWQVERVMLFDFFPRTRHLETLLLLTKDRGRSPI